VTLPGRDGSRLDRRHLHPPIVIDTFLSAAKRTG